MFAKDTERYAPANWEVTVKSDIWAIGLMAYRMIYAGNGEGARNGIGTEMRDRARIEWPDELTTTVSKGKQNKFAKRSIIPDNFELIPEKYSLKLLRVIKSCLVYHPDHRMELYQLESIVNAELASLDRLYGDLYKKDVDDVDDGHKILQSEENKQYDKFAIGQRYNPPRKRRRLDPTTEQDTAYRGLVVEWSNQTAYPRPDLASQARLITVIEDFVKSSEDARIKDMRTDKSMHHCFQYLFACLKPRIAPDAPVAHVTSWDEEEGLEDAFQSAEYRREVLKTLGGEIAMTLLGNKKHAAPNDALHALDHVVRWAQLLLEMDGEPNKPYMEGKTELHRGFRDWIFIHPYPNHAGYTGFAYLKVAEKELNKGAAK